MGSGAGSKYASAFSAVPEGRQALLATVHVIAGPAAKHRAVRLGLSFAGTPKRLRRILFFSVGPITVILKSLQIPRHIEEARRMVTEQKGRIARLKATGVDTALAVMLRPLGGME
jgi:hypothetical protein